MWEGGQVWKTVAVELRRRFKGSEAPFASFQRQSMADLFYGHTRESGVTDYHTNSKEKTVQTRELKK